MKLLVGRILRMLLENVYYEKKNVSVMRWVQGMKPAQGTRAPLYSCGWGGVLLPSSSLLHLGSSRWWLTCGSLAPRWETQMSFLPSVAQLQLLMGGVSSLPPLTLSAILPLKWKKNKLTVKSATSECWFSHQIAVTHRLGQGESQETGTPATSPTRMAGAQVLGTCSTALPGILAGCWIGNWASPLWNHGGLIYCTPNTLTMQQADIHFAEKQI